MAKWSSIGCVYHFADSLVKHLCCFHFLDITKDAAMNIHAQVLVWHVFICLGYIPRSGIAESCANSMMNSLKNCWTVFQSGYIILHSHQQYRTVPTSPHFCQHLLLFVFLVIAIVIDLKWYHLGLLMCVYLMTNYVEQLFVCLLVIWTSLGKCLFIVFAHLKKIGWPYIPNCLWHSQFCLL